MGVRSILYNSMDQYLNGNEKMRQIRSPFRIKESKKRFSGLVSGSGHYLTVIMAQWFWGVTRDTLLPEKSYVTRYLGLNKLMTTRGPPETDFL